MSVISKLAGLGGMGGFDAIEQILDDYMEAATSTAVDQRVKDRAAFVDYQTAHFYPSVVATFKRKAPDGWKGFVWVSVYAWQEGRNPTPVIGQYQKDTLMTLPGSLKDRQGSIGFFVLVGYDLVNSGYRIARRGIDRINYHWSYKVLDDASIVLSPEDAEVITELSDEPFFDYSPSSAKFLTSPNPGATLILRTALSQTVVTPANVTTSKGAEGGGTISGAPGGVGIEGGVSQSNGVQRNPTTVQVPQSLWKLPDMRFRINLTTTFKPTETPKPKAPSIPAALPVYFEWETRTDVSNDNRLKIYKWMQSLPDHGRIWEMLRAEKIHLHVDGYASKTGVEIKNWEKYSRDRAENTAKILREAAGQIHRKDGVKESKFLVDATPKGVAPDAKDGPDPKARVAKIYIKESEVMQALGR